MSGRQQPAGGGAARGEEIQTYWRARPATPGITRSPSVAARPSSSGKVERMILPVFVLKIRTVAASPFGRTMPSSTANGPTAELMLPQLLR